MNKIINLEIGSFTNKNNGLVSTVVFKVTWTKRSWVKSFFMLLIKRIHIVGDQILEMGMCLILSNMRNKKTEARVTGGLESVLIVRCHPPPEQRNRMWMRSWSWEDISQINCGEGDRVQDKQQIGLLREAWLSSMLCWQDSSKVSTLPPKCLTFWNMLP